MNAPVVTIVTPLFDRADLIGETIASVRAQTFPHWEMLVIDDGSTDGSYELVEKIAAEEPRVRLLRRNRTPKGAPTCRNIGAAAARGELLIFLDSDDLLAPFCLEQRVGKMREHPEADFCVFAIALFEQHPSQADRLWNVSTAEDDLTRFLRIDALWQTMGPVYRCDYFRQTDGFREDLPFWQDYELHVRLLMRRPTYLKFLQAPPDCFLRRHEGASVSQAVRPDATRLATKQRVLVTFADALRSADPERRLALGGALYAVALEWVRFQGSLSQALACWAIAARYRMCPAADWLAGAVSLCNIWGKDRRLIGERWFYRIRNRLVTPYLTRAITHRDRLMNQVPYRPDETVSHA